ncbi:MAG: DnaA/Hda family protein [Smithella sp.]
MNNNYTFDRFVVGPSNHYAYDAAIAVARQPAKKYNPLVICGDTGLGKTHLLNAIGLKMMSSQPHWIAIYVPVEKFMNEMIDSIRHERMPLFREYRGTRIQGDVVTLLTFSTIC